SGPPAGAPRPDRGRRSAGNGGPERRPAGGTPPGTRPGPPRRSRAPRPGTSAARSVSVPAPSSRRRASLAAAAAVTVASPAWSPARRPATTRLQPRASTTAIPPVTISHARNTGPALRITRLPPALNDANIGTIMTEPIWASMAASRRAGGVGGIGAAALADLLGHWPTADGPLYRLLATRIARLADTGELSAGLRLPPERDLATALSVSRN